jgi:sugar-specific transcriptional regulator TrmB
VTEIELLKSFGLSTYEAEVYNALIKVDRPKVQELTKMVSVPRPMIYQALKKLVNKGMCTENKGKITHYSAVAPSVALNGTLRDKIKGVSELDRIYKQQKKTEAPFEFIQVLKGNQYREFVKRSVNQASKEILIFCKRPTEQGGKDRTDAADLEIKALKRGIKFRCLYETACLDDSNFLPLYKRVLNHGEVGRVIKFLPMNMLVIDETAASFMLLTKENTDVTVFIFNHPVLILAMKYTFQHLWLKGTDISKFLKERKP